MQARAGSPLTDACVQVCCSVDAMQTVGKPMGRRKVTLRRKCRIPSEFSLGLVDFDGWSWTQALSYAPRDGQVSGIQPNSDPFHSAWSDSKPRVVAGHHCVPRPADVRRCALQFERRLPLAARLRKRPLRVGSKYLDGRRYRIDFVVQRWSAVEFRRRRRNHYI